jgi:hypothetical protein
MGSTSPKEHAELPLLPLRLDQRIGSDDGESNKS